MADEQWYYRLDGQAHGPFSSIQFEKLIRGKAVTARTEVSRDGTTWKPLWEVLAAVPDDPPPAREPDWMTAPTLLPGEIKVPPSLRKEESSE
jgi:hypothetical protein